MGLSPQQVDAMSLWQFAAAAEGFHAAHAGSARTNLKDDQIADLSRLIDEVPESVQ
jgi:hypothetical protein